jgi:hypothetical protein
MHTRPTCVPSTPVTLKAMDSNEQCIPCRRARGYSGELKERHGGHDIRSQAWSNDFKSRAAAGRDAMLQTRIDLHSKLLKTTELPPVIPPRILIERGSGYAGMLIFEEITPSTHSPNLGTKHDH